MRSSVYSFRLIQEIFTQGIFLKFDIDKFSNLL